MLLEGASIARYGDGELKLCLGRNACAQEHNSIIAGRLRQILLESSAPCLVGIPRPTKLMSAQKQIFWEPYTKLPYTALFSPKIQYVSSFITRPDSAPGIYNEAYFEDIKLLWEDRNVVLVNGSNRPLDKDITIFENCTYRRLEVFSQNAFEEYRTLFNLCLKEPKDTLFVLAAGPTATVLAYDLAKEGYQALDLGHIGMFYARFKRGKAA